MNLPKDPVMLVSVLNMKLRDFYEDLDTLAEDLGEDPEELKERAAAAGFVYDECGRCFR